MFCFTWRRELIKVSNSGIRALVPLPGPRIRRCTVQHLLGVWCRRREVLTRGDFLQKSKFYTLRISRHAFTLFEPRQGRLKKNTPNVCHLTICILCVKISCQRGWGCTLYTVHRPNHLASSGSIFLFKELKVKLKAEFNTAGESDHCFLTLFWFSVFSFLAQSEGGWRSGTNQPSWFI